MGFNSAFKGLKLRHLHDVPLFYVPIPSD